MIIENTEYEFCRGSDINRDGMYLEASIKNSSPISQVAEIFYSDVTNEYYISIFVDHIPLKLIEYMIERAKKDLPPNRK